MENLPNDALIHICKELAVSEIVLFLSSCKSLKYQDYERLWKDKCVEFGLQLDSTCNYEDSIKLRYKSFFFFFLSHSQK